MIKIPLTLIIVGTMLFSGLTYAEPVSTLIQSVTNAKRVKVAHAKYPTSAARKGQEGWVKLSFVIDQTGHVIDPVVEDSSGVSSFEKSAIKAIKKWEYAPALMDGKPIEQSKNAVILSFALDKESGKKGQVTSKFMGKYNSINRALKAKDYEAAKRSIDKLSDNKLWNLTENDWFWLISSRYYRETKNQRKELHSLEKSSYGKSTSLGKDNYAYVLSRKFALQLKQQRYSSALSTYAEIQKTEDKKLIDLYAPYAYKIRQLITEDTPIVRDAQINKRGQFIYSLVRNQMSITDIQGQVDELEIRCDNKRSKFTVVEDSIWSIPVSWGKCTAFVKGDTSTTFKLVELKNKV